MLGLCVGLIALAVVQFVLMLDLIEKNKRADRRIKELEEDFNDWVPPVGGRKTP